MKKILLISLFFFISFFVKSQNWQSVGGGANYQVRTLYADTINDVLLIGGMFTQFGDSLFDLSVKWDGNTISKMGEWGDTICGTWGCNPVLSFQYYSGEYFAGGTFNLTGAGETEKYLVKWNGTDWDSTGNPNSAGHVWVTNNELFYLGGMTEISGQPCKDVARWNGNVWEAFYTVSPASGDQIWRINYFQGKYIMAGNFSEPGGLNDILAYDGLQTFALGNGFTGGICAINDLEVYQGLLWAGGYFLSSDGNVNDFIAAWDGQNWFDPFPDVQYLTQVHDLDVIDNRLYIVGNFIVPNDTALYPLAHYDGINFCAFGGPAYYPYYPDLLEVEGLNGRIYVGCNKTLYGDTVNFIAEFIGTQDDTCLYIPLNVNEKLNVLNNFQIFPNPNSGNFQLELESSINTFDELELFNLIGEKVYSQNIFLQSGQNKFDINISHLPSGVYILKMKNQPVYQKICIQK